MIARIPEMTGDPGRVMTVCFSLVLFSSILTAQTDPATPSSPDSLDIRSLQGSVDTALYSPETKQNPDWTPLSKPDSIEIPRYITTGIQSGLLLQFPSGGRMQISSLSKVLILPSNKRINAEFYLYLETGSLQIFGKTEDQSFLIATPRGIYRFHSGGFHLISRGDRGDEVKGLPSPLSESDASGEPHEIPTQHPGTTAPTGSPLIARMDPSGLLQPADPTPSPDSYHLDFLPEAFSLPWIPSGNPPSSSPGTEREHRNALDRFRTYLRDR